MTDRRRLPLRALAPAAALAFACAGGGPGGGRSGDRPKSPFPDARKVEKLAQSSRGARSFLEVDWAQVDRWQLRGPFPERIGEEPLRDPGPWDAALRDVAARRAGLLVVSEAMQCVARELGLFLGEHERLAGRAVQRFALGRCGATGSELQMAYLFVPLPPDRPEDEVLEGLRPRVDQMIAEHLGTGPRAAGLWFGRRGEQGVVFLASAKRSVLVDPMVPVADADGWLRFRGEMLEPSGEIFAHVTQGDYGFAVCENEPGVRPPRFSLACPLDSTDETAWVQISSRKPGRILADGVLLTLARPMGAYADSYVRRSFGARVKIESEEQLTEELIDQVNRIRRRAKLRPLELATEESEVTTALAPVLLGGTYGEEDSATADVAALAMMAGWYVPGVVRSGTVGASLVAGTRQLDRWLAEALESPSFRALVLAPDTSRLAIGPVLSAEPEYLGVAVAGYSLFDPAQASRELESLNQRVVEAYRERGLRPARNDERMSAAAGRHLDRVSAGRASPEEALGDLLDELSASRGVPLQGWLLEGDSADELQLPDGLFDRRVVRFASALGFYEPEEWPWGRTVAFVAVTHDAAQRTAGLAPGRAPRPDLAPRLARP